MAVVSILPHAELGPNDHQEDAHHFMIWPVIFYDTFSDSTIFRFFHKNVSLIMKMVIINFFSEISISVKIQEFSIFLFR